MTFDVNVDGSLGRTITTDTKRLQQVLEEPVVQRLQVHGAGRRRLTGQYATGGWSADIRCSVRHRRSSPSRYRIPASAFRWKSRRSSSKRSSRPTPRPAANMAAPDSASPSAASLQACSAVKSSCAAPRLGHDLHALSAGQVCRADHAYAHAAMRRCGRGATRQLRASQAGARGRADTGRSNGMQPGDNILLIVEDDPHYARILIDLAATRVSRRSWRCAATMRSTSPSNISRPRFRSMCSCPTCWAGTCSASSSTIRDHPAYSSADRHAGRGPAAWSGARRIFFCHQTDHTKGLRRAVADQGICLSRGASACWWSKTITAEQLSIRELLGHDDIEIVSCRNRRRSAGDMRSNLDCVVLDLRLPDMSGFDVLERMRDEAQLADVPVVVFTGRELSRGRGCPASHHGTQHRGQRR